MWITGALAEAAEEVAVAVTENAEAVEAAVEESKGLDLFGIVFIGLGIYCIIVGILTAVTKKFYGGVEKGYEKYTTESVQNCITDIGIQHVLIGLGLIALEVVKLLGWDLLKIGILVAAICVVVIVAGIGMSKKLVKK